MNVGRNDPCPCGSGRKFKHCCANSLPPQGGSVASALVGGVHREAAHFTPDSLLSLFRHGRHAELEAILRTLVLRHANEAFLWGLLGTVLEEQGKDGVDALCRATALDPGDFDANTSLGMALRNRGRLNESLEAYARAAAAQPENPTAQINLGETLRLLGEYVKAEGVLRPFVDAPPAFVDAMVSYADVLGELLRLEDAERVCRKAIEFAPGFWPAHLCLGNLLRKMNRTGEARTCYAETIRVGGRVPETYDNLGCVLQELGMLAEAERSHREALKLSPGYGSALLNLGRLYSESSRFGEAAETYREALRSMPGSVLVLERLGNVLHELGQDSEARAYLSAALSQDAGNLRLLFGQAMLALPVVVRNQDQAEVTVMGFDKALIELKKSLDAVASLSLSGQALAELPLPFFLAYRQGNHVGALSRFADLYCHSLTSDHSVETNVRARVRLVVVSHHVRKHSVWNVILRGLLMHLDRVRFEVVIYHLGSQEDEETQWARGRADLWRDRHTVAGAEGWLAAARSDRPDVIFYPELGMASLSYMLAAHRLAPLQIASWGHPITSGLPTIDLFLSGEFIEPEGASAHYRERLQLLPGTGCCTEPVAVEEGEVGDLPSELINHSGPRFIIAQRAIKFDPSDDHVFAEIASRVPDSLFVMLRDPVAAWATDVVLDRLRTAFSERGAEPDRQIVVLPWLSSARFSGLLALCDVYLDCPSFSGYTTAWQALHCGIPIVTLEGAFMRQRLAAGLLKKVGLLDSVADTEEDYVRIALSLAEACRVPEKRLAIRAKYRAAAHRADNDLAVVRAFEKSILDNLDFKPSLNP